jgi:hypothetical protein
VDSSIAISRCSAITPGWTIYVQRHQVGVPTSSHAEQHGKMEVCMGGREGRTLHGGVHLVD